MGPGIALLLITTLLPAGGIAEDLGLDGPGLSVEGPLELHASATHGQASLEADLTGGEARLSTQSLDLAVEAPELTEPVTERVLGPAVETLSPETLIALSSLHGGLQIGAGQGQSTGQASGGSQAAAAAPAEGLAGAIAQTVASQASVAAAVAALTVLHVEPTIWRPRTLDPRRWAPLVTAGLYTRISRDDVLDHETRRAAYELLRAEPGLSLGEIAERLEVSRSTARHHVRKLEEADMVRHTTRGRCRIHFPVGREDEAIVQHALAHPQRARIAELLEERSLSLVELSGVLDANPGAVHFHLKKLREAGLIERYENGSVVYRRPT